MGAYKMVTWPMTLYVTPKDQTRDPNTLRAQSRKQLEMLYNIPYTVCCEAVPSGIL